MSYQHELTNKLVIVKKTRKKTLFLPKKGVKQL